MREPPRNLHSLQARINNLAAARGRPVGRIQRAIANTVLGQMLPEGVIKGGTAMKLRLGDDASRYTPDFDAARAAKWQLEEYLHELEARLADGWGGFTATVRVVKGVRPDDVPEDYIMSPFDIRLAYQGSHWLTIRFELGRDEVDSTQQSDLRLAKDISAMFDVLGLPAPSPLPVMIAEHQVAQKLHACTSISPKTGRNERAHDLVDLQLLAEDEDVDMAAVAAIGARLFAARQAHSWPPTVTVYEGWDALYATAAEGLDVIDDVAAAVVWANEFVARAVKAASTE